jgi:hypothetical protein
MAPQQAHPTVLAKEHAALLPRDDSPEALQATLLQLT